MIKVFRFSPNFLKVSFPIKNVRENAHEDVSEETIKLNNTQKSIINLIKQDKYITQAEISEKMNKTTRTIRRNMKMLQDENLIARAGSDTAGYWKITSVTGDWVINYFINYYF